MTWSFIRDISFYALLGILSFVPIVAVVASFQNLPFAKARESTLKFLKKWATIAPTDWLGRVFNFAGLSTVLVLLGFLTYGLNRFGDATMPYTSTLVSHFGSDKVRWSIEHRDDDWHEVKFLFREVSGIKGDRLKWEEAKGHFGKYDVRFFRTVFFLFLLVLVAGVVDILSGSKFRKRGYGLSLLAVLGLVASQWLWVERQEQYVVNLVSRYESVYMERNKGKRPELPASYLGAKARPKTK